MNEHEIVEPGLRRLAALIGIDSLALDEEGMCNLEYQGKVNLTLIVPRGSGALYLSASLGPVPAGDRAAFYERLLKLNFLVLDTNGATLALDDEAREVHLCYALNLDHFNEEGFPPLVGNLLERALRMQSEIHEAPPEMDQGLRNSSLVMG
jgi:hypothetical protein